MEKCSRCKKDVDKLKTNQNICYPCYNKNLTNNKKNKFYCTKCDLFHDKSLFIYNGIKRKFCKNCFNTNELPLKYFKCQTCRIKKSQYEYSKNSKICSVCENRSTSNIDTSQIDLVIADLKVACQSIINTNIQNFNTSFASSNNNLLRENEELKLALSREKEKLKQFENFSRKLFDKD